MSGLHGVETIELTTGTVAVQTISTAVIGLVGTAPDTSGGVCASVTAGSWLLGRRWISRRNRKVGPVIRFRLSPWLPQNKTRRQWPR